MGLLRWVLWPLRPRRAKEVEDEAPERHPRKGAKARGRGHDGVYRIEVDSEPSRWRGDGPPFSFWSSSRVILILSLLLWWVQPAGPMIAGYVGGRRAGSPWKAVLAALLPVVVILIANQAYAHNIAARQIDFVASLPLAIGDGVASVLPFMAPYRDFLVAYVQGFVEALRTVFGMGTNGYLMVIIFAYIGGLIGEQTRRELAFRSGAATSVGVNLFQPWLHGRARSAEVEAEGTEDDGVPVRHRRPVHSRLHPASAKRRSHRGAPYSLEEYRKVPAEVLGTRGERRSTRARLAREEEAEEPEDEADEEADEASARHRRQTPSHAAKTRDHVRAEREEEPVPREAREKRAPKPRSHEEEVAIQRFVERALRQYDRAKI